MIRARPLSAGDTIAILAPATTVKEEYVAGARRELEKAGFRVRIMPHTLGPADGTFASSAEHRLADFLEAYKDPEVRAILCARGGYGCIHLIGEIPVELLRTDPKWVIGFSDVSALHAMMHRAGIESLHAPMAKHLATLGLEDPCAAALINALTSDETIEYEVPTHPLSRPGHVCGELRGGNLAVLNGLSDTQFDILDIEPEKSVVLFIEDIAEKIYAVERMLMRLLLSGNIRRLSGLIVGQFTEYKGDRNFSTMYDMIDSLLRRNRIDIPVAFGFPVGHVDYNVTLVEGAPCSLDISAEVTRLRIFGGDAHCEPRARSTV